MCVGVACSPLANGPITGFGVVRDVLLARLSPIDEVATVFPPTFGVLESSCLCCLVVRWHSVLRSGVCIRVDRTPRCVVTCVVAGYPPFDGPSDDAVLESIAKHTVKQAMKGRKCWDIISKEGKDLLCKLLRKNPSSRYVRSWWRV